MLGPRIMREQATVAHMIEIYCKAHHEEPLCPSCQELLTYAHKRLSLCRFGEQKTTCGKCPIHCYKPIMHLIDGMKKPPEWPPRKNKSE